MIRSCLYMPDGRLAMNVPVPRFRDVLKNPNWLPGVDIEDSGDEDIECLLEIFALGSRTIYHALALGLLLSVPGMFYYVRKYRWL